VSLPEILSQIRPSERGFDATISDGWLQGRTSYGGLSGALALTAAMKADADLPPLRSAQIAYVGPLSGDVSVHAEKLRRGKNAAFIRSDVSSEAGLGLAATFVFMNAMESAVHLNDMPAPDIAQPEDSSGGESHSPNFFVDNFDWRHALPKPDVPVADVSRWVRLKSREGLDPMVELIAIADALPPAALPLMTVRAPISTMTWLVNLLTPKPQTRDGWWLIRAVGNYAENGCSSQSMYVWNSEGQPIASAMQSIALFG
jgi:acyl-CoA thioesterase